MRANFGRLISPPSGCRCPRINLNSVDLPTPLRPTRPTLAPTGSDTEAPSKNFRPQPLNTRLSIWSMMLRPRLSGEDEARYLYCAVQKCERECAFSSGFLNERGRGGTAATIEPRPVAYLNQS